AAYRRLHIDFEQRARQQAVAFATHGFDEQRFLAAEVAVHGELGHTSLGRDGVHAGAFEAVLRKQALGRFQNGGTLFQIFGSPGTTTTFGRDVHANSCQIPVTCLTALLYARVHIFCSPATARSRPRCPLGCPRTRPLRARRVHVFDRKRIFSPAPMARIVPQISRAAGDRRQVSAVTSGTSSPAPHPAVCVPLPATACAPKLFGFWYPMEPA